MMEFLSWRKFSTSNGRTNELATELPCNLFQLQPEFDFSGTLYVSMEWYRLAAFDGGPGLQRGVPRNTTGQCRQSSWQATDGNLHANDLSRPIFPASLAIAT